jgi:hypothetical protein
MKIKALSAVLFKRFGVKAAEDLTPSHPTLGDVDSREALEAYQEKKRAYKRRRALAPPTRKGRGGSAGAARPK